MPPDGGGSDASLDGGGDAFVLPEASTIPVRVGIVAVPGAADAAPGLAEETLAHLDVIAAGSRSSTIVRRWDDLFSSGTQPVTPAWQYLGGIAKIYADAGRSLLLSLAVVDRADEARPAGVAGAWDSSASGLAGHALVDRTFATFGDELAYLAVGYEADRYLSLASPSERSAFVAFVTDVFDYARAHPSVPKSLKLGVTLSADAVLAGGPEISALLAVSDVAIVSYHAVDESFQARPASASPGDLDALWDAVGGEAGKSEIVLQEVAYPSASAAGSSVEQQRTFFDGLLLALLSRRERFPFVVVRGSNEQTEAACEADAAARGAAGDPAAIAAFCSFGLRTASGDTKPAWAAVVDGLATFSTP